MARIRTIKPEFWVDDQIVELDFVTRLLFIGLWNFVDDEGYIEYKAKRIKMMVFPADDVDVSGSLRSLLESSRVHLFDSDQGQLLKIANWDRHQRISHATATKFTGIRPVLSVNAPEDSGGLSERSALKGRERKGKERKGDVAEIRPDVSRLCTILADLIEANGSKRPTINKTWLNAARLMIDNDKRPLGEAIALMKWCQADPFWRANIMSMASFRGQYDRLRLQRDGKIEQSTPADPYAGRTVIRGGRIVE